MRFTFRAIVAGLLAGTAFFFIPFLFGFLLFALLFGLIIRFAAGRNRRRWGRGFHHHRGDHGWFNPDWEDDIIPIDGSRFYFGRKTRFAEREFFVR